MQRRLPGGERGLEQVRGVHGAARGGTRADDGVDLVDEHDRVRVGLDLLHDLLEALLEVAAVAGAGEQRAHVEGEDRRVLENLRDLALYDLARETFRDGGLAHARIADEERIVLLAAAENLDRAVHFGDAADERVDLALFRLLVEVDAVSVQRVALFLGALIRILSGRTLGRFLLGAARRPALGEAWALGDTVGDVVHRVVAGHVLLLQEIGGVALALGEDRDEHVGAGHFFATGGLDMDHRALDHALEARRRLGILAAVDHEVAEFAVDVLDEVATENVEIDVAGTHDGGGILVVDEREEQVLQGGVFVAALSGEGESAVEGLFKAAREARQGVLESVGAVAEGGVAATSFP
jgi:hypothetical protein